LVLRWSYGLPSSLGDHTSTSLDYSKATKLEDASFRPRSLSVAWVITALQTITSRHRDLRQISIHAPWSLNNTDADAIAEQTVEVTGQLLELDRLLVHFWESRSVRPRVVCAMLEEGDQRMKYCVRYLLPEITKRGIVDLIDQYGPQPIEPIA